MTDITQQDLKALIKYYPSSGRSIILKATSRKKAGESALVHRGACYFINVKGTYIAAARLAILYQTGVLPRFAGYKDDNCGNLRYENLFPSDKRCSRESQGYKPTKAALKRKLKYNPKTGLFTKLTGEPAGTIQKATGRVIIYIPPVVYEAGRLAILYMEGILPDKVHRAGFPAADNRYKILRGVISMQKKGVRDKRERREDLLYLREQEKYLREQEKKANPAPKKPRKIRKTTPKNPKSTPIIIPTDKFAQFRHILAKKRG